MDIERFEARRWLDPLDRATEALFGIIVTLTFTGTLGVLNAGREEVRAMWQAALACNFAWGVVDACFYLMGAITERGRRFKLVQRLRSSKEDDLVVRAFSEVMPGRLVGLMTPEERASLRDRIASLPDSSREPWLTAADLKGALAVMLWVFTVTLPVVLPFFFMENTRAALRASNVIAIALLALIGWRLARHTGFHMLRTILYLVLFGILMVAITIALGG
ncbi:MAG: VIT1/CCC1 transporter family protein [Flavobacteriales bacterium]|nr:VIT1/CCC1 transporter family protein [Flavobacteriales bacterium]